jgi:hypothetical protein
MIEQKLSAEEEKELKEGQEIYEMTQTAGFKILTRWLEDMAFHSWVDPREIEGEHPEETWKWRELNAFHAANNAGELMERIQKAISQSEYYSKLKSGEIDRRAMRI